MHVAIVGVGADRFRKYLGDVGPELVHGRHHDMARILVVELLDALTEIGLDHLDADRSHVVPETALFGEHRLTLNERLGAVLIEDAVNNAVVLCGVARPMHMDAVRARIGFELIKVLVEMRERVFLDGGSERPEFFPFGNAMHLAIALLPQIPKSLVMHLLVLGRGNEAGCRLCLIDRSIAVDLRTARLRLALDPERLGGCFGMIEAVAVLVDRVSVVLSQQLGMQHARRTAHALAPFKISAIWMNFIGTPMRSAQPCWCIRQDVSADTMYSAPARA